MFEKFSRSWSLTGQCFEVLKQDPGLLVFPLLSSIALLVLLGSFAVPVFTLYHGAIGADVGDDGTTHTSRLLSYALTYVFYVISYTVMMFFNSALISVALRRLDGESAGVREGLAAAWGNFPAIVGYALIAATVGTILRAIEERVGFIGRIVVAVIGAGWTLATAMTLPVLVEENLGPVEAISRSLDLLKDNWGENLIGNSGISLGMAVIAIPLIVIAVLVMAAAMSTGALGSIIAGATLFAITLMLIGLVSTTLHSIYTAALYRFATGSKENAGIDGDLLAGAYRSK
jgi:hypothetical protein